MYYQDEITADMTMLLEVHMNVHELSETMIDVMNLDGTATREPSRVDTVHDESEVKSVASDDDNDILPALKVESEAREGEDGDAVKEASDSDTEHEPRIEVVELYV